MYDGLISVAIVAISRVAISRVVIGVSRVGEDENIQPFYVPCESLQFEKQGTTYACYETAEDDDEVATCLSCTMKFVVGDCDPNTGEKDDVGYEDEYALEDVEMTVGDHVMKVAQSNFIVAWEELGEENQLLETFQLDFTTLQEAVEKIQKYLGMQACERSDRVEEGSSVHKLLLAGVYRGGHKVMARCNLVQGDNVTMKLTVRSEDATAANVVIGAIG